MSDEKNPTQRFEFLTSGVVKEKDSEKRFPKKLKMYCMGPGVVRESNSPLKTSRQSKDAKVQYGKGPGVVKGKDK